MFFIAQASVCTSTLKTIDLSNITTIGMSAFEGARRSKTWWTFQSHDLSAHRLLRMHHAQDRGSLQRHGHGRLRLLQVLGFHGRAEHAEADRTRQIPLPRMQEYHQGERSLLESTSCICLPSAPLLRIDMPILKTVENFCFNRCEGLTKSICLRSNHRLSVQQLPEHQNGQSPQRQKHRRNRLQQLLAHHLHFPSGASDLTGGAFSGMTGLTTCDVPLWPHQTVPSSMFQNCKSLTAIDLPAAKDLGMNAIRGCDALWRASRCPMSRR